MNQKRKSPMQWMAMFSVASVLFGWHAGGGFATGNQANQFYIGLGWLAPVSAVLALLLLTLTVREALIMYNQRNLKNYKQLFACLYHPLDKLELLFEVFYHIMVIMATSSSIAGAGTLFEDAFGISYTLSILIIGVILLLLTMFGAELVRSASSVMSILILICAMLIFLVGIWVKKEQIGEVFSRDLSVSQLPTAFLNSFQYAGFQCASIPTMIACGTVLTSRKSCKASMWLSFVMNAAALSLSVFMLLGWKDIYTAAAGGTTIPTLTICKSLNYPMLILAYNVCLFLCFVSTGVSAVFGIANRFEGLPALIRRISSRTARYAIVSTIVMTVSVLISVVGLTNIVKYGYGYCGYLGIVIVVIPFLTIGAWKNRKYQKEHPEHYT